MIKRRKDQNLITPTKSYQVNNKKKYALCIIYAELYNLDSSYQFESESEQDEDDHNPVDEEGLPLLWKSRSIDLDAIPRKTEDQYSIQWSVFTRCCH